VATNSTRSSRSKKARAKERATPNREVEAPVGDGIPENAWRIGIIIIFLIAAGLRLYDLNLVPFITTKVSTETSWFGWFAKVITSTTRRIIMVQLSTISRH